MTKWKLAGSTALLLVMTSHGMLANVTPEDVWQSWQDGAAAMGQKVTAKSAARAGDALVVTGVMIAMADANGSTAAFDTISFKDNGDGTVGIILPDSYPVTVIIPQKGSDTGQTDIIVNVTMPGATITASGTPQALSYKTDAPELTVALGRIEPADGSKVDASAEAKLTGLSATYLVEGAESGKKISEDFAAKSFDLKIKGSDAKTKSDFNVTAAIADFGGKAAIDGMPNTTMTDLAAALKAGFAMDGSFSYGATTFNLDSTSDGKPTKIAGTVAGGDMAVAMDASQFKYAVGSKALQLTINSPDIPIPDLTVGYGETAFNLTMPVTKSDTPSDFTLLTKIVDLKLSDAIWAMIDPSAALPHDPATLILDTKGKATLTKDLMQDAANVEAGTTGSAPPGMINALDLTQLNLKALGAEVTGNGSFTFDNSDMTTFSGVPAPTGKIDLKAVGANALIDKLVAMGLIPQDQAMQGRMMISMFANTDTTKDEMTSTLEFKDKHFFANGQQLQ